MKFIFFVKGGRKLPSSRTRAYLISDYINTIGILSFVYLVKTRAWWDLSLSRFTDFFGNLKKIFSLDKDDIVYLQRTVHQVDFIFLILIRKIIFRRGYVFDFDDAIYLEKGNSKIKLFLMLKFADTVITGGHGLLNYAKKYNKNSYVVTTLLDSSNIYKPKKDSDATSDIVIGWVGSPSHYENLKLLQNPLSKLVLDGYNIKLVLVGTSYLQKMYDLFNNIKGLKTEFVDSVGWDDPRNVVKYIQGFTIGVMPLLDNEWNRGRDAYKAKEYMSCGVATICSDVGENKLIIKDGENGLLANTENDWYEKFKKLIDDVEYRKKIAQGGRRYVEKECSFSEKVPELFNIIMKGHNKTKKC